MAVETLDPAGSVGVFRFNHLHPPFNNPAIQQMVSDQVNVSDAAPNRPLFEGYGSINLLRIA